MPAPLETLLSYLNSGYVGQAADDSIIGHFGGDDLLKAAPKGGYSPEWIQQQINANTYDTAGNPIAGQGYDATIDALRAKRIAALQALQQRLPPTT